MLKNQQPVHVLYQRATGPKGVDRYRNGIVLSHRVLDVPGSATHGDVIYTIAFGEPGLIGYEEREFHQSDVQRFIPLPDEAAAAKHAEELPMALHAVETALAALLPDEKVEVKDGSIFGYHGGVTLDPVVYETKRIGAVQESAGWQVTTWRSHPATRWEPEDVSDSPQGTFPWAQAVRKFIEVIFALKAADYWQAGADEAYAQSLADEM